MRRPRQRMLLAVVAGTGITVCGCAAAPTPQMNPAGAAPATTTVGVASAMEPPIGPTTGAQTPAPVGASGFPMPPPGGAVAHGEHVRPGGVAVVAGQGELRVRELEGDSRG